MVHNFRAPQPPPSQPTKWWIFCWILRRRATNRIANTQPKLRTNPPKIANKQNYEQTGVSDNCPRIRFLDCNDCVACGYIFVLRRPAAILFISRDTCSDSIAEHFRACFIGVPHNYRAICCKMEVLRRCACVKLSTKGGVSHHFGRALTSLKKYRTIWGWFKRGNPPKNLPT